MSPVMLTGPREDCAKLFLSKVEGTYYLLRTVVLAVQIILDKYHIEHIALTLTSQYVFFNFPIPVFTLDIPVAPETQIPTSSKAKIAF